MRACMTQIHHGYNNLSGHVLLPALLRSHSRIFFIESLQLSFGLPVFRCPHTSIFYVLIITFISLSVHMT